MSLPINSDNSPQITLSFTTVSTPETLDNWTKINTTDLYNTSLANVGIGTNIINGYKLNVNGSCKAISFYGDGANITNIPYSTITGKPANFPADWNSTVINKPDVYIKTEVNNINILANYYNVTYMNNNYYTKTNIDTALNGKEATLTFSAPLTRTTNTIGINLNSYPTYTALAASNYVNTTTLNSYPSFTVLNSCNFITNSTNTLTNYYNITYMNNNYYTKTTIDTALNGKEATLTFNAPLTRTTNTIGINLNSYPTYTALAASNYVNTTTLNSYPTYTALAASNYVANSTTGLINYPSFTVLNSCNFITNSTNTLTNYYTKTTIDTALSNKEATLTFNAPLTRTTNTIGINLNNYPSFTVLNSCNYLTAGNFVAKSGDTMTGDLNTTGLNIKSITVNNWLFNNNGGVHEGTTDFNLVTTAGYKFIVGNTNSPSTSYTQYYSWLIGLGSNYPVTGPNSYSCQFAVPRLPTNNPRLFIRFNETNSWGSWGGLIASSADALTSGDKTISGNLSVTTGLLYLNAANSGNSGTKGIYFRDGYNVPNNNNYNCSILTYDHSGDTFPDGLSINAFDGISFCTGANTRQERMRIDQSGNITTSGNITSGSTSYVYAGGLRIGGWDTGNTIYSGARNIGITFNTGYKFSVNSYGGNGEILSIDNSVVAIRGTGGIRYDVSTTNSWYQYIGQSPSGVADSLIFQHRHVGISPIKNSFWWLNGFQSSTSSEISDKRSKYNIQDFDSLEIINKLEPKSFDVINDKDINHQYGFIAQDIEQIPELSKLVHTTSDYIANVNSYGNHTSINSNCIITANDDLTGKINIGDELKFVSNNDIDKEFVIDATPYINRYKRRYAKVTEIISSNQFKVDCEINNFCSIEDPFLIYGKKVDDAKSLDYNSFIALNTKAIQELYKIIQRQQEQIDILMASKL